MMIRSRSPLPLLFDLRASLLAIALASTMVACGGDAPGETVRIAVRSGAPFAVVADSLAARDVIGWPKLFGLYARARGQATGIKPGTYDFRTRSSWGSVLDDLVAGRIVTGRLVVPEGLRLPDIIARVAAFAGVEVDSLQRVLGDSAAANVFGVPGPTLEGYLYPATYTLPIDAGADTVVARMVDTYLHVWTDERRARAAEIGLTERQVVTLASIIEKEAVRSSEMPLISAVYHNRLRIGMPLQADPTVQYALGGHRERLLYADIERVRDHPYNTYNRTGLPPGPIASPGVSAIDAALTPATSPYLFFVARPDGSHVFSRTLAEHNRARTTIRREQRQTGASR